MITSTQMDKEDSMSQPPVTVTIDGTLSPKSPSATHNEIELQKATIISGNSLSKIGK
jgi:hypothetical protein